MKDVQINPKAFPHLDQDDLHALGSVATCHAYKDGEEILKFGQRDVDLIVIDSGAVDIQNPIDNNSLIITHHAGQFIGDIDLLTRRPIIYRAVARGETKVMRVPNAKIRRVLGLVPSLGEKLIEAIQARREALQLKGVAGIQVYGLAGCGGTNRIREFLYKNFVPFTWADPSAADGQVASERVGRRKMPFVDCGNGVELERPTLQELADKAGVWHGCAERTVDLAIVGAGPAGIAAAVYAASEGLKTIVIDQLGPGGQAGGSSRIENFIGFPAGLSGTDLATRGVLQMLKFGAEMVAPVHVKRLEVSSDPKTPHQLHLDCGTTIHAFVVLAATGVSWRRLPAINAQKFERAGVYYACTTVEAGLHENCELAVVGGGNSAGQAAMFLATNDHTRTVHLMVRRPLGSSMSDYLVQRIAKTTNIKVHENAEVAEICGERTIDSIRINDLKTKDSYSLPAKAVFVFIGAEPRADWLPAEVKRDELGYVLSGADVALKSAWPLKDRGPCPLETSVPRLLVGGDLRSGSTKRVGFAVGDGSLACTCVHKLRSFAV